jgi:hypothetical protein
MIRPLGFPTERRARRRRRPPARADATTMAVGGGGVAGVTFDGLDMHLYTWCRAFVMQLLGASSTTDPRVGHYGSLIQGRFFWAGRWGRIFRPDRGPAWAGAGVEPDDSDLRGVYRAVVLCPGMVALVDLSVSGCPLGYGGEWAVGASLLSETCRAGGGPGLPPCCKRG